MLFLENGGGATSLTLDGHSLMLQESTRGNCCPKYDCKASSITIRIRS